MIVTLRPALPTPTTMRCCGMRSEEHTSELQSQSNLVCRLLLEKKKKQITMHEYVLLTRLARRPHQQINPHQLVLLFVPSWCEGVLLLFCLDWYHSDPAYMQYSR